MKSLLLVFFILFNITALADDSSFIRAIETNDLETAQAFLSAGADPNLRISFITGTKPLHITAFRNLPDMARLLIRYDANPNPKQFYDFESPPLYFAITEGHLEVVKALVEAGADFRFRGNYYYLRIAYNSGREDIISYLESLY